MRTRFVVIQHRFRYTVVALAAMLCSAAAAVTQAENTSTVFRYSVRPELTKGLPATPIENGRVILIETNRLFALDLFEHETNRTGRIYRGEGPTNVVLPGVGVYTLIVRPAEGDPVRLFVEHLAPTLPFEIVGIEERDEVSNPTPVSVVGEGIRSVTFLIDNRVVRTVTRPPWSLGGDDAGEVSPFAFAELEVGRHALKVRVDLEDGTTAERSLGFFVAGPTPKIGDGQVIRPADRSAADTSTWSTAPNRVGNSGAPGADRIALARWDAVSERDFRGQFPLGVVAHHLYGIDYVEFQVDGGAPVRVNAPSVNPRTRVDGYWVVLDANDFADRRIEVRATAYPHNGIPRKLEPLFLFANQGGTLQFPVLELPAGRHTLSARDLPTQGWLTVRPAPGVSREQCVIVGRSGGWKDGNLKLENVTHETLDVNGTLLGFDHDNRLWLDNVRVVGLQNGRTAGWIAHAWTHQYYTDCEFTRVDRVFQHGPVTARNIVATDIYEDFANANGLYANITVDRLDRLADKSNHPDLFQFPANIPNNLIIQDVTSTNNNGQGLFTDDMRDVAVVRLDVTTVNPFRSIQLQGRSENILIQDSNFNGPGNLRTDKGFSADDVVMRNNRGAGSRPTNGQQPGVSYR
ncbi:MAG: hypothetical protein AAGH99_03985 [Planctomycetota bacterium]